MKQAKERRRIETKASHTALMASIYRFLATKEQNNLLKGPDYLANLFLPPQARFFLSFTFFRKIFHRKLHKKAPGSYEYICARTRFFDDLFQEALKQNIPQIVILGAGFDTRAIRYENLIEDTQVFELDVPTTQEQKIDLLEKSGIEEPVNLSFASINFDKDDIKQVLAKVGYEPNKKSLFIWEGVSMYITREAVNNVLAFVKLHSGKDSSIAFDYLYKSVIQNQCNYYGAKELSTVVKQSGEAFSFGIEEGKIADFLSNQGFEIITHYRPEQFERKYLNIDGSREKMYGFACHVHTKAIQ